MSNYKPPIIILVEPQMGENIGASARAMKNFACHELRIVNPRDGWPNDKAISMSAGADDIITNATIYPTLSQAIADIEYVFATSAARRDLNKSHVNLKAVSALYPTQSKCGILFGREKSGLTNSEISLANTILTIPTAPDFSSLNLGQAVLAVCYELFTAKLPQQGNLERTSKADLTNMLDHLIYALERKSHFKTTAQRPQQEENIRNIFTRIEHLSAAELRSMHGIIRSLSNIGPKC